MDKLLDSIYWYCTDFCINMANLLGISYVTFNLLLFMSLMPVMLLTLLGLNVRRYVFRQNG
ncbi:MAG: hypothetical protein AAF206_18365 [Bacteroidota bacterium]